VKYAEIWVGEGVGGVQEAGRKSVQDLTQRRCCQPILGKRFPGGGGGLYPQPPPPRHGGDLPGVESGGGRDTLDFKADGLVDEVALEVGHPGVLVRPEAAPGPRPTAWGPNEHSNE